MAQESSFENFERALAHERRPALRPPADLQAGLAEGGASDHCEHVLPERAAIDKLADSVRRFGLPGGLQ
eukprot:5558536-Alexandrium_andersonii.AAC.1